MNKTPGWSLTAFANPFGPFYFNISLHPFGMGGSSPGITGAFGLLLVVRPDAPILSYKLFI